PLNHITATHAAASVRELNTHTPAILLPEHYTVQQLEQLAQIRSRVRGSMTTASPPAFCHHIQPRAFAVALQGPTGRIIDVDTMSCKVFFNLGNEKTPGHADDTASLKLKPTAAFAAVRGLAGQRLSQSQLAEWIEDWASFLRVVGTQGEDIPVGVAVQKIR